MKAGLVLAAVLIAATGCRPVAGERLEPVGEARMDLEHKACLKEGGQFLRLGKANTFFCEVTPRDAGQSCSRASDCESACLARSRTCAPVKPLFGCNEVLTESGEAARLCVD